jgi:hypothetical protein
MASLLQTAGRPADVRIEVIVVPPMVKRGIFC